MLRLLGGALFLVSLVHVLMVLYYIWARYVYKPKTASEWPATIPMIVIGAVSVPLSGVLGVLGGAALLRGAHR
jgi:hypothetical protein